MKKIYFLVNWNKDKEKTWSGTCYGLYSSLAKYSDIVDIQLSRISFISRILRKLKLTNNDFGLNSILQNRRKLNDTITNDKKSVIFQFSEIINKNNSFIYQDLSVSYIKYLSELDKTIFHYSGFCNIPINNIVKRELEQNDYYKQCGGIFTMGQWLRNDLIKRCGIPESKVHHVGGGINVDKNLIKNKPKRNNKILFVGRDFRRKGGYIVIEAFKILKQKLNDVELYVAGPSTNPINENIDKYYFLGDCNKKQLSDLYNKCDIFCMPSYFEAYGLVFIEALTYGLPCIGRNVFEMPYFIEDNKTGLLLKNDDPYELSQLMEKLLYDEEIKKNVLSKRDWYINEYSWDTVANKILNVINCK